VSTSRSGDVATSARAEHTTKVNAHALDLLWTFIRTDFKSRYHGTIGGFLWALLKPAAMFVVLLTVFSFIFSSDDQYNANLLIGLFVFDFFSESSKTGIASLHAKGYLLTKARFPSWIVVVSSVANAVITLSIFVVVITAYLTITSHPPSVLALGFFVFYLLMFLAIVIGFSLGASVLFLRYRDLNQVWEVIVQAGFFLAPVVYPLRVMPERYHFFFYLWPPTPVIEFSRSVLVAGVVPSARAQLLLVLEALCVLTIGMLVFRRYSPRAAEHV
jgi:lipopolysaccharide transport system permease protein